jgi:4-amino-4-deoxy-L-arabinose transferase-like glycosyltransferase
MEYKADEAWTFEHARGTDLVGVPWLGMPSSVDVPNPGMSLWVFVALRGLSGAHDPPGLARAVQVANCLALVLLAAFAWRRRGGEREAWLWAAALVAVNPLAVLFHRKLWPPCVLPLLTLAALWGWWHRGRRGPAFVWGLVGACLGQIHMAGFFFAGGFALWAFLFDRRRAAWRAWLAGSLLGALPLVPWAWHLWNHPSGRPVNPERWVHALEGKFWVRWFTESFGLGIDYTLGPHFREFLSWPVVHGRPTWLVGVCHLLIAAGAAALLVRAGVGLVRDRRDLAGRWVGRASPTAFTQSAALWGFGLLLTLSCFSIHRHYMIVLFPLEALWVARLALGGRARAGRAALGALWAAQLVISATFLAYVHDRQHIHSEYGSTYAAQRAAGTLPPPSAIP